jgi:allantoicase
LRGLVDLAALDAGGWVESCSDMFFGSRNNLIRPGPSRIMADGWETRRRRGPGHDWALVRLAARGTVDELEIDTSHFKHNAPGRCLVEGRDQGGDWRPLVASPLQPHTRHRFAAELRRIGPITHVRLNVYPDGGVARLRVRGLPVAARPDGLAWLDAATPDEARAWLLAACGSRRWAERMTALRPFEDLAALLRLGEQTFWELGEDDLREAFAAHPKIGERKLAAHEAGEQAGAVAAGDAVRAALADRNAAYLDRFGFIYIVCASGRSAEEMLADLEARLGHDRATELRTAAEEQCKITRLRLARGIQEMVA